MVGSNAAGAFTNFLDEESVKLIAVKRLDMALIRWVKVLRLLVLGKIGIIHGSKTLLIQTEDGQITEPYSISSWIGLSWVGPLHAHLHDVKRAEFIAITDSDAMQAGLESFKNRRHYSCNLKPLMLFQFWIKTIPT